MNVLLDLDDVLAQFVAKVLAFWNEDHPEHPRQITDVREWGIASALGPAGKDFIRSVMRYNHLYEYLEPVPGAVEGVKALMDRGHDVTIVTTVPTAATNAYDGKMQWVRDHLPFFPLQNVIACGQKYKVRGDVLLDDGIHNLEPFDRSGGEPVAFDSPWNQQWKGMRVRSWPEFLSWIDTRVEMQALGIKIT